MAAVASGAVTPEVVDDRRQPVILVRPAQRIISISPHLTELVFAAGAGDQLVATVRGADFPVEAMAVPIVGDAGGLDFERIRQLEPDLVLAWGSGNRAADLDRLERAGITLYVAEAAVLADISDHLREIGILAGTSVVANKAAARFDRRLARLQETYSAESVTRVFVEIWNRPIFTVNDEHILNDVLRTCGAHNVFADYPLLAGPVPLENVVAGGAEVILSLSGLETDAARKAWWKLLPDSARTQLRVVALPPELLTRATPRLLEGTAALCLKLQPSIRVPSRQPD